ncbi:transglutaminase [Pseudomonas aeruginosa]|nr:transglutaminase [Pseudomonas aeruginosa]
MNAIPRVALVWLLVAQVLVILPHLAYMPLWIAAMWLGCAAWRVQVFRMRAGYPRAWVKLALALLAGAGVWLSRGSLVGLDAGAVLLIAAFILKLVEMKTRRDALVLVFLGSSQWWWATCSTTVSSPALYSLLPVTALLAALIGLQQSAFASRPWPTLRLAGGLLLQALPLMLLLFLFFPRLGPLWSLPMPGNKGVTGLSESMAPGDIAELGRSAELAFRVRFEGAPPPREQLYWRALTMERFDGTTLGSGAARSGEDAVHWQKRGPELRYDVIMQPSSQPWLFALDVAQTDQTDTRLMSDFHLQRRQPVEQRLFYRASSWPQALRESSIDPRMRWRNLQLPMHGNPRARALAEQLRQAHAQPQALVAALFAALQPRALRLHPETASDRCRRGGRFPVRHAQRLLRAITPGRWLFVLRAAGIPARVVAGYQGGELNPAGNYLLVHQFDAHAWVEYWQPEQGWLSVDPTYQVAPERIEQGLEQALAGDSEYLADAPLSPLRYRGLPWLNDMRLAWDSLNYGWQRWVLAYQGEQQGAFLQRWFGGLDPTRLGLLLGAAAILSVGLLALFLLKPWQGRGDLRSRQLRRFERLLEMHGLRRSPGEGLRSYGERAARVLPAQAPAIAAFVGAFEAQRYGHGGADDPGLRLRALRRALPWRLVRAPTRDGRGEEQA